jgi:ABC-2 type transport system permease protein
VLLRNVFTKSIWDARRSLPGWTVAIVAVGLMYAAFWPTMRSPEMAEAMAAYPRDVLAAFNYTDMATAQGYLGGAVYGLLVPLLVAVFAIAWGARGIAGDEDAGTLDLVLAHPVSRRSVAVQRFGALLLGVAVAAAALLAAMVALRGAFELGEVAIGGLVAIHLQLALFGACFGALAFAAGAATGSRAVALGAGSGVAVLAYLANSVFPQVAALEWTRAASPFHWYLGGDPLTNGVQWSGVALLLATTLALLAAGTLLFTRRDLAT